MDGAGADHDEEAGVGLGYAADGGAAAGEDGFEGFGGLWMVSIEAGDIEQRVKYSGDLALEESWWDERVLSEDCGDGVSHSGFLYGHGLGVYLSCPRSTQSPYLARR